MRKADRRTVGQKAWIGETVRSRCPERRNQFLDQRVDDISEPVGQLRSRPAPSGLPVMRCNGSASATGWTVTLIGDNEDSGHGSFRCAGSTIAPDVDRRMR